MPTKKKDTAPPESGAVYITRGSTVYTTAAHLADMTGKSEQWIGKLARNGILAKQKTPRGVMYDLEQSVLAYTKMLEERAKPEVDEAALAADKDQRDSETMIKKAKAIKLTLEAKELQGKMFRVEDYADITADLIYAVRSAFMAMPGRLATEVIQAESAAEASEIIRKEVYSALEGLANYKFDPKRLEECVRERNRWSEDKQDDAEDGY